MPDLHTVTPYGKIPLPDQIGSPQVKLETKMSRRVCTLLVKVESDFAKNLASEETQEADASAEYEIRDGQKT